jgi:hypothetical protein
LSYQFTNRLLPVLTALFSADKRKGGSSYVEEPIQPAKRYSN